MHTRHPLRQRQRSLCSLIPLTTAPSTGLTQGKSKTLAGEHRRALLALSRSQRRTEEEAHEKEEEEEGACARGELPPPPLPLLFSSCATCFEGRTAMKELRIGLAQATENGF
jgi:hypothetical protein